MLTAGTNPARAVRSTCASKAPQSTSPVAASGSRMADMPVMRRGRTRSTGRVICRRPYARLHRPVWARSWRCNRDPGARTHGAGLADDLEGGGQGHAGAPAGVGGGPAQELVGRGHVAAEVSEVDRVALQRA